MKPQTIPTFSLILIILASLTSACIEGRPTIGAAGVASAASYGTPTPIYQLPTAGAIGYGATLQAGSEAISAASTAQSVFTYATQSGMATQQTLILEQTRIAIVAVQTRTELENRKQAGHATRTQQVNDAQATSQTLIISATQQAIAGQAENEALTQRLERERIERSARLAMTSESARHEAVQFLFWGFVVVALFFSVVLFYKMTMAVSSKTAGYTYQGGHLLILDQHTGQWQLPAPKAKIIVNEPEPNRRLYRPDEVVKIDGQYTPKLDPEADRLVKNIKRLLRNSLQINGQNSNQIASWRKLKQAGLQPSNPGTWQPPVDQLKNMGLVEAQSGKPTEIICEQFPTLGELYSAVCQGRVTIVEVKTVAANDVIDNDY